MSVLATTRRFIAKYGEPATLTRAGETDLPLKAKRVVTQRELEETGGTSAQLHNFVKIGTAELTASSWTLKAPQRTDKLVLGGRTRMVLSARPVLEGGTTGLYVLELAG